MPLFYINTLDTCPSLQLTDGTLYCPSTASLQSFLLLACEGWVVVWVTEYIIQGWWHASRVGVVVKSWSSQLLTGLDGEGPSASDTTITCITQVFLPAQIRVYSPSKEPIFLDEIVTFLIGKLCLQVSAPHALINTTHIRAIPGDLSDATYVPDFPLSPTSAFYILSFPSHLWCLPTFHNPCTSIPMFLTHVLLPHQWFFHCHERQSCTCEQTFLKPNHHNNSWKSWNLVHILWHHHYLHHAGLLSSSPNKSLQSSWRTHLSGWNGHFLQAPNQLLPSGKNRGSTHIPHHSNCLFHHAAHACLSLPPLKLLKHPLGSFLFLTFPVMRLATYFFPQFFHLVCKQCWKFSWWWAQRLGCHRNPVCVFWNQSLLCQRHPPPLSHSAFSTNNCQEVLPWWYRGLKCCGSLTWWQVWVSQTLRRKDVFKLSGCQHHTHLPHW